MFFPFGLFSRRSAVLGVLSGAILLAQPFQSRAQMAPVPVGASTTAPDEAQKFLALFKMQRLCKTPLDLNVQNASLADIAAQVRKTLPQPAPPIEVRRALPLGLTFQLKGSTVGAALRSAGLLADTKLYVFTDHLLLAPETRLSVEEQAALDAGLANQWAQSGSANRFAFESGNAQKIFTALVTEELKAGKNGVPAGGGRKEPSVKTTFGQLSPDSQEMLWALVDPHNAVFAHSGSRPPNANGDFIISPDTVIELNPPSDRLVLDSFKGKDTLSLSNGESSIGWPLDGSGVFRVWGSPTPTKPKSPPPFLDPSAGKS